MFNIDSSSYNKDMVLRVLLHIKYCNLFYSGFVLFIGLIISFL